MRRGAPVLTAVLWKNDKLHLGINKWQYNLKGVLSNSSALLSTDDAFPKDVDHFGGTFVLLERC